MSELTKPLALGDIRTHVLMTDEDIAGLKQTLAGSAQIEGYALTATGSRVAGPVS